MSRLCRKIHQDAPETKTEISIATANPHLLCSIPLMTFIPKSEAMSVGNIMMMETEVSVRITVFMLLLMILE